MKPQGTTKDVKSKDGDFVFVAGATGRVGSRTVRLYFVFDIDFRLYKSIKPTIKCILLKDKERFQGAFEIRL